MCTNMCIYSYVMCLCVCVRQEKPIKNKITWSSPHIVVYGMAFIIFLYFASSLLRKTPDKNMIIILSLESKVCFYTNPSSANKPRELWPWQHPWAFMWRDGVWPPLFCWKLTCGVLPRRLGPSPHSPSSPVRGIRVLAKWGLLCVQSLTALKII